MASGATAGADGKADESVEHRELHADGGNCAEIANSEGAYGGTTEDASKRYSGYDAEQDEVDRYASEEHSFEISVPSHSRDMLEVTDVRESGRSPVTTSRARRSRPAGTRSQLGKQVESTKATAPSWGFSSSPQRPQSATVIGNALELSTGDALGKQARSERVSSACTSFGASKRMRWQVIGSGVSPAEYSPSVQQSSESLPLTGSASIRATKQVKSGNISTAGSRSPAPDAYKLPSNVGAGRKLSFGTSRPEAAKGVPQSATASQSEVYALTSGMGKQADVRQNLPEVTLSGSGREKLPSLTQKQAGALLHSREGPGPASNSFLRGGPHTTVTAFSKQSVARKRTNASYSFSKQSRFQNSSVASHCDVGPGEYVV